MTLLQAGGLGDMAKLNARVSEIRDRAYGGKAGIWLKKRKRQVVPNVDDKPSSQQHKKVTPLHDIVLLEDPRNLSSRTIIGWDDVRCRPIYEATSEFTAPIDRLGDKTMEDMDATHISDEAHLTPDASSEKISAVNVSSDWHVSKRARAYGSRKRKPDLPEEHVQRKRTHVSTAVNKGFVASMSIGTHSLNHIAYDLATPQRVLSSICSALNSDTKATPLSRAAEDDVFSDVAEHKKPRKERRRKGFAFRKKQTVSTHRESKLQVLAQLNCVDDNVPVGQPSSSTSLDAAKAFFERLDSEQQLTLDASNSPGKACVRTRRAIHMQSDGIRQEYKQYAAATKACGVDPLAMEQYARNRATFFRTRDMFDGFLDE